jgi:hypothetical protein
MKRKLFWLIVGLAGATLAAILFLTKDLNNRGQISALEAIAQDSVRIKK